MKYQIKGSTVPFTNTSTSRQDVVSWAWYLDSGDGGGYSGTPVATSENTNITFPDVAGRTCRVKLVASGLWGDDVFFEDTYYTVTDIPGPSISTATSPTFRYGDLVDYYFELDPGTGAGNITWSVSDGNTGRLTLDPSTGRLSGIFCGSSYGSYLAGFQVKAVDSFGREAFRSINVAASPGAYGWYSADYGVVYDGSNLISKWENKVKSPTSISTFDFIQNTALAKPIYVSSFYNGLPAVHFDTTGKYISTTPSGIFVSDIFFVIKLGTQPSSGVNYIWPNGYPYGGTYGTKIINNSQLNWTTGPGENISYIKALPSPNPIFLSLTAGAGGGNFSFWENGLKRLQTSSTSPGSYSGALGNVGPAGFIGHVMEVILMGANTMTTAWHNALIKYFCEKYALDYYIIP